ncbi:MAG: hypothetical protein J0I17_12450 ['Candidatus Kapabacteria' thiocyanatum]|uniref:Outer membrane protein beta-barrel domain-containing protein n=1 Tax=Candidatus Kapaibacterium thiocyanatum TaxID=1895771 RepID=A0A1M3L1M7_9BACT|nr:hypothetical protein ['Candidatus Kapabacteria' thiocyanatum]OJX58728.1 MAG: hypothetical protein BGO89_05290 ['Candidatus Kapabacteria' thiocyanatum]
MKRLLLILLAGIVVGTPVLAQDDKLDDLSFEEMPLKDEAIPYFAVGVGPVVTFGFPDLADVNRVGAQLATGSQTGTSGLSDLKSPMVLAGAEIFTAIGIVPNLRVGFSWITGSSQATTDVTVGGTPATRTLEYGLGLRTIHIDYAWVPFKSFSVLPGVGLGWGTQSINYFQGFKGSRDLGNFNTPPDVFAQLERSILYVAPRLNVEYALAPFLLVRAQAGYSIQASGSDWKGNRTTVITGVPDGIKAQNFSAQIGLFVGLFN